VVVRPDLDSGLKTKLKAILLNMHQEKEGMAILKEMSIDRFIEVEDSLYDSIREIRAQLRKLDRL
jgi:ABC-type phosphate/phosphonate transport system substrate-binding protein